MFLEEILQKLEFGLFALLIEDEDEANDVSIAFLVIVGWSEFENLFLFFIDVLALQPFSHCLCCSFSVVRDGLVFVFGIEEKHSRESFHLVFTHKLLILGPINSSDMHSFANHFGKFAVLGLEIAAMSTLC